MRCPRRPRGRKRIHFDPRVCRPGPQGRQHGPDPVRDRKWIQGADSADGHEPGRAWDARPQQDRPFPARQRPAADCRRRDDRDTPENPVRSAASSTAAWSDCTGLNLPTRCLDHAHNQGNSRRMTSPLTATRRFRQGRCQARLGPGVRRVALFAAAHLTRWCGSLSVCASPDAVPGCGSRAPLCVSSGLELKALLVGQDATVDGV